jgi:two-component system chemotaxis response regulator CheY
VGEEHVLLIEPDWKLRRLIRANLEALGLKVSQAVSGQHGLQLARRGLPDVVVIDLDRLEMDPLHLLGVLYGWSGGNLPPVILLSSDPPDRQWMRWAGMTGFVQKPFAAPHLIRQVQQALCVVRSS